MDLFNRFQSWFAFRGMLCALLAFGFLAAPLPAQNATDEVILSPAACGVLFATTAAAADNGVTGPHLKAAATGNPVLSITTNTTAGTIQITCPITIAGMPGASGAGRIRINDVALLYGVQTTALTSVAAPVVNKVLYPNATAAAETALGTVSAAGGTLTVVPTVLPTATTTAGLFYNERITFGTGVNLSTNSMLTVDQVFTTAGTSATVLQIAGVIVHYTKL